MRVQPAPTSVSDHREAVTTVSDSPRKSTITSAHPTNMPRAEAPSSRTRTIAVGSRSQSEIFASNAVKTSIYTPLNFIPKNMFKQFTRFSNVYFLFITALQLIPEVTSTPGLPTMVVPLFFIIVVSAVRDLIEDLDRHHSDRIQNRAPVSKMSLESVQQAATQDGRNLATFESARCADVVVGELVRVAQNEEIPADIVLLAASNSHGQCFVMTANLDGESSLKPRYVLPDLCSPPYGTECFTTDGQITNQGVERIRQVVIECEPPNRRIDRFEGSIHLPQLRSQNQGRSSPTDLDISHILLKGTQLKDTAWVVGVVVYTGDDTRVRQNSSDTPIKLSWLYRFINKITLWVVLAQIVILSIAVAVEKRLMTSASVVANPYIDEDIKNSDTLDLVYLFLAYMLLFSNFVPISLQVTIDFTRYFQAIVIQRDPEMHVQKQRTPGSPRRSTLMASLVTNTKRRSVRVQSSELNEELGLVEYVFTDKTGTLTCNRMEFRACHIDGESFKFDHQSGRLLSDVDDIKLRSMIDESSRTSSHITPLRDDSEKFSSHHNSATMKQFLMNLAVNNTISPTSGIPASARPQTAKANEPEFSGPSPDEKALVVAAARLGIQLTYRDNSRVSVRVDQKEVELQIVQSFEFTSDRKKSSVVCRHPDGSLMLYCKGADTVILAALGAQNNEARIRQAKEQMKVYSADGLRVLCIAERTLNEAEYAAWSARYNEARAASKERSKSRVSESDETNGSTQLNALISELECNLTLVGISGIEDKIQEGAPETLEKFREAGIKVWMLTGDRPDTAANVAFAVRLISNAMRLIRLTDSQWLESRDCLASFFERELAHATTSGAPTITNSFLAAKPSSEQGTAVHNSANPAQNDTRQSCALIVSDEAIEAIQQFRLEEEFLALAARCDSVLCARISPKQKESIVQMVRGRYPEKVTMSVGDGANDVPMIQRAHIGVGIAGEEGNQASDASDYSIPAFRFLQKLVLVHGRWMNRRTAVLTLYIFYKNVLLVLPQFVFGIYCLFSGQSSYYDPLLQLFNICFTSLPVMYFSVFDQDISATMTLLYPQLYQDGSMHCFLNKRVFIFWMLEATIASILIILVPAKLIPLVPWSGTGKDNDLWSLGLTQNFIVVFLANARLLIEVSTSHRTMALLTTASVSFWWVVVYGASLFGREFYGILRVGSLTTLAICTVFCSTLSLCVALIPRALTVMFAPSPRTVCRELDYLTGTRKQEYSAKRQASKLRGLGDSRAVIVPT